LASFLRCPDDTRLCVTLESIDRSTALLVVFVSHCWTRGYDVPRTTTGGCNPTIAAQKFAQTVEGAAEPVPWHD
jgi:hypothetical protein